jgi:protein SCO1/2
MILHRPTGRASATVLILVASFAAAFGLWWGVRFFGAPAPGAMQAAVMYPAPRTLPAFQLTRSDNTALTLSDWQGHWTVAFFGYTHCPDVCPTTLATFKQVWKRLDPAVAANVRFDFISVDPARDTPEQLARYVGYFNPAFIAATGNDEALAPLTQALGMVYSRGESGPDDYTVDHSASAVIIDPQGRQAGLFRPPFDAAKIAADLATLAGP